MALIVACLVWQAVGNAVAAAAVELVVEHGVPALSCRLSKASGHIVVVAAAAAAVAAEPVAVAG